MFFLFNEIGTLKSAELDIPANPDGKPRYFRARPVPYKIKD